MNKSFGHGRFIGNAAAAGKFRPRRRSAGRTQVTEGGPGRKDEHNRVDVPFGIQEALA
jgi:hypothetical protein